MIKSQDNWIGLYRKSQQENPVRVVLSGDGVASSGSGVVECPLLGKKWVRRRAKKSDATKVHRSKHHRAKVEVKHVSPCDRGMSSGDGV